MLHAPVCCQNEADGEGEGFRPVGTGDVETDDIAVEVHQRASCHGGLQRVVVLDDHRKIITARTDPSVDVFVGIRGVFVFHESRSGRQVHGSIDAGAFAGNGDGEGVSRLFVLHGGAEIFQRGDGMASQADDGIPRL